MRSKLFPLFVTVFVCLFSTSAAFSQTLFGVDEGKLSAALKDGQLVVKIPVRGAGRAPSVSLRLDILNEEDVSIANSETVHSLNLGLRR